MDAQQLEALISRLQVYARADPRGYRTRVVLLTMVGYAFLWLVLAFVVAGVALLVAILVISHTILVLAKLVLPLLVLAGFMMRALFVKFVRPEGRPLTRHEAPRFFEELDRLRERLVTPRFDAVLVDDRLNASVAETPRLGILGWPRRDLVVGLPLLFALSPPQLLAVLAHEMGHHSARHGRIGAWVHRVRSTWVSLLSTLERERKAGAALFRRFAEWYAPYFEAYTFVLARQHEFEADRSAAELTSAADLGEALVSLEVKSRYLAAALGPGRDHQVTRRPDPPETAYTDLRPLLARGPDAATWSRYLRAALTFKSAPFDSHPPLGERLAAIGVNAESVAAKAPPMEESAADLFLGPTAGRIAAELDRRWLELYAPAWRDTHQKWAAARNRLDELAAKVEQGRASPEEEVELAFLVDDVDGPEAALPRLRRAADLKPDNHGIRLALGRSLLWRQQPEAVGELERVLASADARLALPACQMLAAHHRDQGDVTSAMRFEEQCRTHEAVLNAASLERQSVSPQDVFTSHDLEPEAAAELRGMLGEFKAVKLAWLVRKAVRLFPDSPLFVLVVKPSHAWFADQTPANQALANQLAGRIGFPGEGLFIVTGPETKWLLERVAAMGETALVYRR